MTTKTETVELNRHDGHRLLDEVAQRRLNMTADEFLAAHDAGNLDREDPAVLDVEILIPFAR